MAAAPKALRRAIARAIERMIRLIPLIAFVAAGACGAAGGPAAPPMSFGVEPDQTVTSDSGALTIAVWFAPDPPSAGSDAAQIGFTDAGGATVSGLDLSVVPWMPAHGHGTSVNPTVTETAPGVFVATPLYLFMPGSWELRMTIGGTVDDTAKASFEIP
jgi:hypothetical protein